MARNISKSRVMSARTHGNKPFRVSNTYYYLLALPELIKSPRPGVNVEAYEPVIARRAIEDLDGGTLQS